MKTRATILDIAKRANLTDGTVSRVLRNSPLVKPATRERVLKIAEQLGYRSSVAGRGLVTGKTQTLGFITPSLHYPLNARMAELFQAAVGDKDYGLLVTSLDNHDEQTVVKMKILAERYVDGIIFQPTMSRKDIPCIDMIERYRIPFVVTTEIHKPTIPFVSFNNVEGARIITRHVLDQGYRRPALVTGWESLSGVPGQVRGFREELTGRGIDPAECPVIHQDDFSTPGIVRTLNEVINRRPNIDCLLSVDSVVTTYAYLTLRERAIAVGPDFGLAGFDDVRWFEPEAMAVTSLEYPLPHLVNTLVEMLLDRIDRPDAPVRQIYIDPQLAVRKSTSRKGSP